MAMAEGLAPLRGHFVAPTVNLTVKVLTSSRCEKCVSIMLDAAVAVQDTAFEC